jgi:hypothetical protein
MERARFATGLQTARVKPGEINLATGFSTIRH